VLTTGDIVSSPQISQWMEEGQMDMNNCYWLSYEANYDLPENSGALLQANGYFTITITDYDQLSKYNVTSSLTDTTTVLADELPIVNGCYTSGAATDYFIVQQIVRQPSDMQLNWEMSYDYATLTNPKTENGTRYYDLYVRATKKTDGTKPAADMLYVNAYYLPNFMSTAAETEKTLLGGAYSSTSSTFKVRVNYVTAIKDSVITWQNVEQNPFIATFVRE
jgi:hypothetical protein